jgi:hypothetical protein
MNFEARATAMMKGLSPMVKHMLPPDFIRLVADMAKALDTLTKDQK